MTGLEWINTGIFVVYVMWRVGWADPSTLTFDTIFDPSPHHEQQEMVQQNGSNNSGYPTVDSETGPADSATDRPVIEISRD